MNAAVDLFDRSALSQRLGSVFGFRPKASIYSASNPSITTIYRGYDEAHAHSQRQSGTPLCDKESTQPIPTGDGINAPEPTVGDGTVPPPGLPRSRSSFKSKNALNVRARLNSMARESEFGEDDEVTDLILIVHGIGQGVSTMPV